ncbi:hypothetical protein BB559_006934 [Furculomyces boomerangus]|uniref:Peptidase S1 domain-containing protein n=1 Tax=Furculomyces boomerangus TaxID=61424 RepID=A0A2T9XZU3_9FUNG|nr:hypothetical protein BB559_006934 [Furculomyces boomerangus]
MNFILGLLLLFSILQAVHTYDHRIPKITNIKVLAENTARISKRTSNKILNGVKAEFSEYSSAASLYIDAKTSGSVCTGTFISKKVVLTAAHCVYNKKTGKALAQNVFVSGGTKFNFEKSSNIYSAQKILVYPSYDASTYANDIALIFLQNIPQKTPYTFAKLYNVPITDNTLVEAAGWGATNNNPASGGSEVLMVVPLHISSSKECNENYPLWKSNSGKTICTIIQNGQDTCLGGSGGPLYFTGNSSKPIVGITSFGAAPENSRNTDCGVSGYTGYYTNVQYYIDWISKNTQIDEKDLVFDTNLIASPTLDSSSKSQSTSANQPTPETQYTSRTQPTSGTQYKTTSQSSFKSQGSTTKTGLSATLFFTHKLDFIVVV